MTRKILVVDDEREFAATLAQRLRLRGFAVETFNSAEEALESVRREPPEVLLLDVKLLRARAMELLMTVRQHAPGVRVVLLTGHIDHESRIEGLRLDSFPFLMKPLVTEELLAAIGAVPPNRPGVMSS